MQSQNKIHKATAASFHRPTPTTFSEPLAKTSNIFLEKRRQGNVKRRFVGRSRIRIRSRHFRSGDRCCLSAAYEPRIFHLTTHRFSATLFPRRSWPCQVNQQAMVSALLFFGGFSAFHLCFFRLWEKKISRPQRKLFIFNKRVSER